MNTYEEAIKKIEDNVTILTSELAPLEEAAYRVLADDIIAKDDFPPFDNSAMDGYAVQTENVKTATDTNPIQLKLKQTIKAGSIANENLNSGEAIKIMTGAPLPIGADAVVMKELTEENNGAVNIFRTPRQGENIRSHGEDIKSGQIALRKGTTLRPYELALLAAQGIIEVSVIRKPKVSIIATGDELIEIGEALSPGKIRNSNSIALNAAITRWGGQPDDKGIVNDAPEALSMVLQESISECDVLLITGGVSVGDFDYTKSALEKLGMETIFWKVAIKPGKPLLFGIWKHSLTSSPLPSPLPLSHRERVGVKGEGGGEGKESNTLIFGLPGNPVSALVCLEEFVRPALERMQGKSWHVPSYHLNGILDDDCVKDPKRQQFLFAQVSDTADGFKIHVIRPQGSAMVGMACSANALAVIPIGTDFLKKGSVVPFRWLK